MAGLPLEECLDCTMSKADADLTSFYAEVIREDISSCGLVGYRETLETLRRAYVQKVREYDSTSISFESPAVRCCYVYYYCPSFAGAVMSEWVRLSKSWPGLVEKVIQQDTLTVCCLGGGPATEIVAMFHVIRDVLLNGQSERKGPLRVEAVVVDVESGWSETAGKVAGELQKLVEESVLQLSFRFVTHDLMSQPITEELREILSRSDVVTMVKFFSGVHGVIRLDGISRIIQLVCESMDEDCILLLLDSSGWKYLNSSVLTAIRSCETMTPVYEPTNRTYRMSSSYPMSSDRILAFGAVSCNTETRNIAGAWRKSTPKLL